MPFSANNQPATPVPVIVQSFHILKETIRITLVRIALDVQAPACRQSDEIKRDILPDKQT